MSRQDRFIKLGLIEPNIDDIKESSVLVWENVKKDDNVYFNNEYIGIVTAIYPECSYPNGFIIKTVFRDMSPEDSFIFLDNFANKTKTNIRVNHRELSGIIENIHSYAMSTVIIFRLL